MQQVGDLARCPHVVRIAQDTPMRFGILGPTRAWHDDGGEVALGGPTRRALLALLLLRAGTVVPPDQLIDDLYGAGAGAPAGAAHALQSQVSRLRQTLRADATIERLPTGYQLSVRSERIDAVRFERLAEEGREALLAGEARAAAEVLRAALTLWRGPALADAAEATSTRPHVARLEERRLAAQEDRIEADLRRGAARSVLPEVRELVDRHPLRERLHVLYMRALRAEARQAEALVVFERIRERLADELGADPGPELAEVHLELLRGDRRPAAPVLPAQLTTFVGRDDDVPGVAALLGSARLVTLVGPGGAGKTRLSIEVASRRPDTCFVEISPLRDERELPPAILGALGLRDGGLFAPGSGTTPVDRLAAALADRPLLLVLDNCEHLVEPVAALAQRLLAGASELRVLATSREPLGITGEHLWPVGPLPLAAATQLFADRAAAVRPGFVVEDASAELVRRICTGLDGLPLAIELAAARMRGLELTDLAARLDDRFRLLSRGSRTAQARHRTLRAVVAWSWDLLSEAEQVMARRLSVFVGGTTVEAAARVCGFPDASEAEDLLDSLADKSLLEGTSGRYHMLATIQAYCAERLNAAGEAERLAQAHAGYFLDLATSAEPHLLRAEQLDWLAILDADQENLLAALRRRIQARDVEVAMRLLAALSSYLWIRGLRGTVAGPAVALLDLVGTDPPAGLEEAYILCGLAAAADSAGRDTWSRHRPTAEALLADRPRHRPVITFFWPVLNAGAADPQVALSVITAGVASTDPWERAVAQVEWGYPHLASGDLGAAEREFSAALAGFRSVGDRWGTAFALDALAGLSAVCSDYATALTLTDEALLLAEELNATEDLADLLCNRADYRLRAEADAPPSPDSLALARTDYDRAAEIARRAAHPTYLAAALRGRGDIAWLESDLPTARRCYEDALARFEPHWIKSIGNRVNALFGLGRVAAKVGDLAGARERFREAVEVAASGGPLHECADAVTALAEIAVREGDAATAAQLLGVAAAFRAVTVDHDSVGARVADAARTALGASGYDAAYRAGSRRGYDEALRLVGVPESVIASSPHTTMAEQVWAPPS